MQRNIEPAFCKLLIFLKTPLETFCHSSFKSYPIFLYLPCYGRIQINVHGSGHIWPKTMNRKIAIMSNFYIGFWGPLSALVVHFGKGSYILGAPSDPICPVSLDSTDNFYTVLPSLEFWHGGQNFDMVWKEIKPLPVGFQPPHHPPLSQGVQQILSISSIFTDKILCLHIPMYLLNISPFLSLSLFISLFLSLVALSCFWTTFGSA